MTMIGAAVKHGRIYGRRSSHLRSGFAGNCLAPVRLHAEPEVQPRVQAIRP